LEQRLIYGSYPELIHLPDIEEKKDYLEGLVNSYLLKDILAYEGIKKADKIIDLLRLIAFQIGNEVSIDELSINLKGISRNTIESYLDLLSKVFVIYPVKGFSRNLRKEISKSNRWYFYDNGIRNALIRNYNPLSLRNDIGQLWENYLMSERMKINAYLKRRVNTYFWRTYDQQEIDLVEESGTDLAAFEFKWNKSKVKIPTAWKNNYADATFEVICKDVYLNFVLGKD
jgi:predicted AAA+ superfamily ATPase